VGRGSGRSTVVTKDCSSSGWIFRGNILGGLRSLINGDRLDGPEGVSLTDGLPHLVIEVVGSLVNLLGSLLVMVGLGIGGDGVHSSGGGGALVVVVAVAVLLLFEAWFYETRSDLSHCILVSFFRLG